MKKMIAIAVAASCVACYPVRATAEKSSADAEAVVEVREVMQDALRKLDEAANVRIEEQAVVHAVFNEGTNSSFIARTELTATQKRFLEMGRRMMQMAVYIQLLEARLAALEEVENEKQKRKASLKALHDKNAAERKAAVRRAIERQQSGQSSKRNRSINDAGR